MASGTAAAHSSQLQLTPDVEIVAIVRNGNVAAFDVLVERYHRPLMRHLTYRLGDPELGADIVQDALLDAFRRLDQFDDHRPFAAWLYGIAHKRVQMHWRRQRLLRFISLDWLTGSGPSTLSAIQHNDGIESLNERDMLLEVINSLTPPLREALLLHSLDGFTAPEIAGILGISQHAAKRRVSRAKEQFRELYRDQHHDR